VDLQFRYYTSFDGTRIAYATFGEGPALISTFGWAHAWGPPWELPHARSMLERLGRGRKLVLLERRGLGASQRNVEDVSVGACVADLGALVEHLGLSEIDLLAAHASEPVVYAAEHPDAVRKLVLWGIGGGSRGSGQSELARLAETSWSFARRAMWQAIFPSGPEEQVRWCSKAMAASMSPEVAAKYLEREEADYRTLLPGVKAPTLVLHRGNRYAPMDQARAAALLFPSCRFVPLDGDIYHFLFGDLSYVDTIIDFLDEDRRRPRAEGLPSGTAIILFADIADSTGLTERLGDTAFREKARELDEALRRAIASNGGTAIEGKLLGDGVLAVFGAAREAIACAGAMHEGGRHAGLPLHVGIHAGDVLREEGNVFGGAVNIAARVAGEAAAGETLVSGTVRDLARTSADVSFLDRGEHELKGVSDPVRLYEVRWRD